MTHHQGMIAIEVFFFAIIWFDFNKLIMLKESNVCDSKFKILVVWGLKNIQTDGLSNSSCTIRFLYAVLAFHL